MELGQKIKARRELKGLTLEQVGNFVGVTKSTVRKWETGAIKNMGRDKISKLAEILDVSPAYLVGDVSFSFISDDLKDDKQLNDIFNKLIQSGYLVEAINNVVRLQNRESSNIFFLTTSEIKNLKEDVDNYFKARIEALEQKYKDKGTRGLW